MPPSISEHYNSREPSAIRKAQILFHTRFDSHEIEVINLAIGNISLPMHPSMLKRMKDLGKSKASFESGVVKYTASDGTDECKSAIIKAIDAELSGNISENIKCVVTDGGSQAMELMLLGVADTKGYNPILVIDPLYTNYVELAKRLSLSTISLVRPFNSSGSYKDLEIDEIESKIRNNRPNGILIIPADNPTGSHISKKSLIKIAKLCVKYDIWLISDEAYRNIYFTDNGLVSIWDLSNEDVAGIEGLRISIESVSKVWNACGLRIGALVTDNNEMFEKARSEYTANLCANVIGQYIFGAVAHLSSNQIIDWYSTQREYYSNMIKNFVDEIKYELPGIIISLPQAAIYIVLDFSRIAPKKFIISDFIEYCALFGKISINNKKYTLLLSPMNGFYHDKINGKKQARIALVESKEKMKIVPNLLSRLYISFIQKIKS